METIHLTDQFNKPPKRNGADERAPLPPGARRTFTSAGTAPALATVALRLSPLWHVDGTSIALPACSAGDDQLKSL